MRNFHRRSPKPAVTYTARWSLADPPTRRRPPKAEPDPSHRPPAGPGDPDTPRLPLEPGEWDLPRVPLLYQRAVIASTVLHARLRAARRTGRALYDDVVVHQQAARPEQLPLLARRSRPYARRPGPVDVAALRTDLEALELTADQLRRLGRAGQRLRKDSNQRAHQIAVGSAPRAQDARLPTRAASNSTSSPAPSTDRGADQP